MDASGSKRVRAISITEYLDRAGRSSAPEDAPRANAEALPVKEIADAGRRPAAALIFAARKVASLAGDQPAGPALQRRSDRSVERQNPDSAALQEAAAAKAIEARIAEAYERGLRDGRSTARAEAADAHVQERNALAEQALADQIAFKRDEYARLDEQISDGLAVMEDRVCASVARILRPMLEAHQTEAVIKELRDAIVRLSGAGSTGLVKIHGPENLLSRLRTALAGAAIAIEYDEQPGADMTVQAGGTMITTQLQAWKELLAAGLD
jgi:flagellar biosynthesis/type III secretory pathway protein FliH